MKFQQFLGDRLPPELFRMKGIVWFKKAAIATFSSSQTSGFSLKILKYTVDPQTAAAPYLSNTN